MKIIMSTLQDGLPLIDHIFGDIVDVYLENKLKVMELIVRISIVLTKDDNKYIEACSVIDVHSSSKYYAIVFPFNLLVRQKSRLMILLIDKEDSSIIPNIVKLNQLLPKVKLQFKNKPTSDKEDIIKLGKWLLENFNS